MKVYADDYYTVVAESIGDAKRFFLSQELTNEEGIDEIREIDPSEEKMLFPVDELPEQYQDEEKYPQKNALGHYIGVNITLCEAMLYKEDKAPYILCVSGDLM